jgi:hypothetical protein
MNLTKEEGVTKKYASRGNEARTPVPKRPYRAPQLIEYGHITKLTAGTTGSHTDKGHNANEHGSG